ncbi:MULTISPECIES: hypothetical protein [unclassified Streptomyces]|uniref:hypothetical protein n=1 Tax=unclassified Streptomyces TaxID=2593676 RepID=UPI00331F9CF0
MEDVLEAVEVSHESLTRLLAEATTDTALVSGAMCLYRVLPILCWEGPSGLYESIAEPGKWSPGTLPGRLRAMLEELRGGLDAERFEEAPEEIAEMYSMASEMVLRFFEEGSQADEWSDWCSTLGLDIHQQLDALLSEADETAAAVFVPAGTTPDLTPLESQELGDQISTLVRLGDSDAVASRGVLDIAERGHLRARKALELVAQSM